MGNPSPDKIIFLFPLNENNIVIARSAKSGKSPSQNLIMWPISKVKHVPTKVCREENGCCNFLENFEPDEKMLLF